jgi:hypothetical protein
MVIQSESAFGPLRAVTTKATVIEDRLHVACEIDGRFGRKRELRRVEVGREAGRCGKQTGDAGGVIRET